MQIAMLATLVLTMFISSNVDAHIEQTIPLYPHSIPGAIEAADEEKLRDPQEQHPFYLNVSQPTLKIYLPRHADAKRAAVIICPGGGYLGVSIVKEGYNVASAFNEMGVAAIVLKYRTPSDSHMSNKTQAALQDLQQAIRVVHAKAKEWNIDPDRVGVAGFSAGGHVAAMAATQFDHPLNQPEIIEQSELSLRPDFLILGYPVISMSDEIAHQGSRKQLLGSTPTAEQIAANSAELHVSETTPPTFLMHAADDKAVVVANSFRFAEALTAHHVPVELIVYPHGGHGFGLNNATTTDHWIDRCRAWMLSMGLLAH